MAIIMKGAAAIMARDFVSLEDIPSYFETDRFACEQAGCRIEEYRKGFARCSMHLAPTHYNGAGSVMGGAVFTLADFTAGVAANADEPPSVSSSATIEYLNSSKGDVLYATATVDKSGRRLSYVTVDITDDRDVLVARMITTLCKIAG